MQPVFSTLFKQKTKSFEILFLVLLLSFLYLTFKLYWWKNLNFIDMFLDNT